MITSMMRRALLSGDGSTLNVDFTTGALDSRLTFTRGSNATFINSSGMVEYANSNMLRNSVWTSTTLPSGWLANGGNTGTLTYNGNGTITASGTSQIAWMFPDFPYVQTTNGLTYVCSYKVESITGTLVISDILSSGNLAITQYFIDGAPVASNANVTGPCVVSVSAVATGTQWFPRIGLGVQGNNRTGTVVMSRPHAHPGTTPRQYLANTSTSADNYNTPRFDHDPSTQAPKGLLIEGTSTNRALRSNDFNTTLTDGTQWNVSGYTRGDVSTTLPDGTTGNACRISGTGSASFRSQSIAVTASTTYTFSFWARNNGGSQARYRVWNVSGGSSIVDYTLSGSNYVSQIGGANNTSTTWVRVSVTFTTPVGCTAIFVYPTSSDTGTVDVLLWGAQVEEGSGASSYIPTGASTASRSADTAIIAAGAAFTSWYTGGTSGTFYADWHGGVRSTTSTNRTVFSTSDVVNRHFHLMQTAAAGNLRVSDFGASSSVTTANAMTSGARTKGAFSFNGGNVKLCLNGGTVASGGVLFSTAPTYFVIGGTSTNGTSITDGAVLLNGSIRQIKYWPTILPDAQLQSITT